MSFLFNRKIAAVSYMAIILSYFTVVLLMMLSIIACEKPAQKSFKAVPVETEKVTVADVPVRIRSIGTVEPLQSVEISSQVGGYLRDVLIKEGQSVKEGQIIFRIDSRKFEVVMKQIEAGIAQISIQLKNAAREAERAEALLKDNIITAQEFERLQTAADSLKAALGVQEAMLDSARLDLDFCTIRSPIKGRAGSLLVNKGDLVKAGSTVFVRINQISPVRVRFSIPEKELGVVREAMSNATVKVTAESPQNESGLSEGVLVSIDNTVDVQTGSIILKAEFPNEAESLWPGQFVEATSILGTIRNALLVPSGAIQNGQQGAYVFVVEAGAKAALRWIKTGITSGKYTVIQEGLLAEELIVTDGQLKLGEGTPVEIKRAFDSSKGKFE